MIKGNIHSLSHMFSFLGPGGLSKNIMLSKNITLIALYSLIITVPVFFFSLLLMMMARARIRYNSYDPENRFQRIIDFCEKRWIGRLVLGFGLCSPTIVILVLSVLLYPQDLLDGVIAATIPWILFPIGELLDYRREKHEAAEKRISPT